MSNLRRIRETGKAIAAIKRAMRAERDRVTQATREAVSADAVRSPERATIDGYAARMDAAQRAIAKLTAERAEMEAEERARIDAAKMSDKRREFLTRYYLRGEARLKLQAELGVSRWTVRRWIAAEEGRAKKG